MDIKLTSFSHGAGCGCKISPEVLDEILKSNEDFSEHKNLLIGNKNRDDAAVFQIDKENAVISTTDFFMPIVDDPVEFGKIASVNAISDVYAMGGSPIMAISILGWPIDKIPAEIGRKVINGARQVCEKAGIPLAGGHSIDSPEPIFGLAVTGTVKIEHLKSNSGAQPGDQLYLTKPIGVGIMTTALKNGILKSEDYTEVVEWMITLNDIGADLGKLNEVHALTDVTGFGLLGHLFEMCEGSGVSAEIDYSKAPLMKGLQKYIDLNSIPGGTGRNWKSYGHKVNLSEDMQKNILCDPQTSGGLLVAVDPFNKTGFEKLIKKNHLLIQPIGKMKEAGEISIEVV